jgi:hypothetical protein
MTLRSVAHRARWRGRNLGSWRGQSWRSLEHRARQIFRAQSSIRQHVLARYVCKGDFPEGLGNHSGRRSCGVRGVDVVFWGRRGTVTPGQKMGPGEGLGPRLLGLAGIRLSA